MWPGGPASYCWPCVLVWGRLTNHINREEGCAGGRLLGHLDPGEYWSNKDYVIRRTWIKYIEPEDGLMDHFGSSKTD